MKSIVNRVVFSSLIVACAMLATPIDALAVALPGEVDKGAGILEALLKSKWVIMLGAAVIAWFGFQLSTGKATLERFLQVAIGSVILFGAIPIAYFMANS